MRAKRIVWDNKHCHPANPSQLDFNQFASITVIQICLSDSYVKSIKTHTKKRNKKRGGKKIFSRNPLRLPNIYYLFICLHDFFSHVYSEFDYPKQQNILYLFDKCFIEFRNSKHPSDGRVIKRILLSKYGDSFRGHSFQQHWTRIALIRFSNYY